MTSTGYNPADQINLDHEMRLESMKWWNEKNHELKFYICIQYNSLIDGDRTRNPDSLTGREIEILYKAVHKI